MRDFEYYSPTKIFFGDEYIDGVGQIIKSYGYKKILFHYGKRSIFLNGLYDRIVDSLNKYEVNFVELGNVTPNPKIDLVRLGVELAKKEQVEMILCVGGGSVIDSGKAIACGACVDFDPWCFSDHSQVVHKALKVGSILTISAAGSELSNSCVITNEEISLKNGFNSDIIRPLFTIMNPNLTNSLSSFQTACGIVDIMMHTMERYLVLEDSIYFTEEMTFGLLKSVYKASNILKNNPNDYNARSTLMLASSFSHNGLTGLGTKMFFTVHRLEHVLSGNFDRIAHAEGLAVLFPSWVKWSKKFIEDKLVRMFKEVFLLDGENNSIIIEKGISFLKSFFNSLGLKTSLKELGLNEQDLALLISKSKNIPSFVELRKEDIRFIFEDAF